MSPLSLCFSSSPWPILFVTDATQPIAAKPESLQKASLEGFQLLSLHRHGKANLNYPLHFWPVKLTTNPGITKLLVSKVHCKYQLICKLIVLFILNCFCFDVTSTQSQTWHVWLLWICFLHLVLRFLLLTPSWLLSWPHAVLLGKRIPCSSFTKNIIPLLSHSLHGHVAVKNTIPGISLSGCKSYSLYFLAMWPWPSGLTYLSLHISSENWFPYY